MAMKRSLNPLIQVNLWNGFIFEICNNFSRLNPLIQVNLWNKKRFGEKTEHATVLIP